MMIGIKVKIVEIEPDAVYNDVVYTQDVMVMLPDGKTMSLFDPVEKKASEEMIGQTKVVTIFIPFGKVEKIGKTTPRIEPLTNHPSVITFYGIVENKNIDDIWHSPEKYRDIISLNVGIGNIIVHVNPEEYTNLKTGYYLKIEKGRVDVAAIHTN